MADAHFAAEVLSIDDHIAERRGVDPVINDEGQVRPSIYSSQNSPFEFKFSMMIPKIVKNTRIGEATL